MNKRILLWTVTSLGIAVVVSYIIIKDALYLGWSQYKIPGYPVGGSENEIIYAIDPKSILTSLDRGETEVFLPAPLESGEYTPPIWTPGAFAWNQEDHLKVANALHQFTWKASLEDWDLYDATFWVSPRADNSYGIDYAYFVFFRHKDNEYIVHTLSIDLLYGETRTGEGLYHDKGWKGFRLSELKINSADQALLISAENGGQEACLALKSECHMRVSLGSYLAVYPFLSIPFYRYEWKWIVNYYDEGGDTIFSMSIDPYSGEYKILNTE